MRNIKSRLTNLKNKVSEILPEDEDILGFAGITKQLIVESINDTYQVLDLLADYEKKFEAILLQRRLADCIDKANEYLKEKFKHQNADDFNRFLNKVGEMHYAVKETYIIFTKEPIRLDASLQKAKETLAELENQNIELQPIIEIFQNSYDNAKGIVEELTENNTESTNKLSEISNALAFTITQKKKADTAVNSIEKANDEIQTFKKHISDYQVQTAELTRKLKVTHDQSEINRIEFENVLTTLQASIETNEVHQRNIQDTIESANRAGMAASFKRRKDELVWPYWAWGTATVVTIAVLIGSSYNVFTMLKDKPFSYDYLLIRIPIFAAFVWLGWFCAKQFGFVSRIREDYSYKYAVSMAFEGYKNATKEINAEMLEHLLTLTLQNISSNPLNIYETGSNHGTPMNEILASWTKKGKLKIKKDEKNKLEFVEIDNGSSENGKV